MSTRAIQARIECDRETLGHLWRTHVVFNRRLPQLISVLFRMRRECGATDTDGHLYTQIARFILARGSRDAPYLLHSVSVQGWEPNTARKMKATVMGPDGQEMEISGEDWAMLLRHFRQKASCSTTNPNCLVMFRMHFGRWWLGNPQRS